jgi:ABC-type sugar transport system, periplasmic component
MKMKKYFEVFLLVLFLLLLSACTKEADVAQEVIEQSIYRHTGKQEENVNETISIYYGTIYNAPMMNAIANDYEEATGVRILWQAGDSGSTTLKGLFSIGDGPDLFQLAQFDLPQWRGCLADLSNEVWVEDVYESALRAGTVDGKIYGWPHTLEASGIIYNKELFERAGITKVPQTLEELEAVCKTLEEHGIQSFGESWREFGYLAHLLATPFNYEQDIAEISSEIHKGEKTFADLVYIDRFFKLYDLTLKYGLGANSVAYNTMDQYPDFAEGKMAMMKQGTWVERSLKRLNEEMNIGIMPVPLSNQAEKNKLQVVTTTFLCVNKESKNKEKALEFLEWWHFYAQRYLVNIDGVIPPFYSVDTSSLGMLNAQMENYIAEEKIFDGFGYEYWPTGFQINLREPLQTYAVGLLTKEEALEELQKLYMNE